MNQGKSSDEFSFKDCHFDLSGAKSLSIAKDSAMKNTTGSNIGAGPATVTVSDDVYDYSFYKTDEFGKHIKVLLYGNDDTNNSDAIDFSMVPVMMEISDDGKYILMGFSKSDNIREMPEGLTASKVIYIVIVADSGKIYELPPTGNTLKISEKKQSYYGGSNDPAYSIIGTYDSGLLMYDHTGTKYSFIAAYVDGSELVVKELISQELYAGLSDRYRVFNNGIIATMETGENGKEFLAFPNGGICLFPVDVTIYCDNLCTSITYYDEDTKMFASSFTVIKSFNKDTSKIVTEDVTLTKEQSYEMVAKSTCRNELVRGIQGDGITIYAMESVGHIYSFKLNTDCTVTDYGRTALPITLRGVQDDTAIIATGDYFHGYSASTTYNYTVVNGHICQTYNQSKANYLIQGGTEVGDMVVSGDAIYKIVDGTLKQYKPAISALSTFDLPANILTVKSMEADDSGRVIIQANTTSGTVLTGALNLSTGEIDASYASVLKEVRLVALN